MILIFDCCYKLLSQAIVQPDDGRYGRNM